MTRSTVVVGSVFACLAILVAKTARARARARMARMVAKVTRSSKYLSEACLLVQQKMFSGKTLPSAAKSFHLGCRSTTKVIQEVLLSSNTPTTSQSKRRLNSTAMITVVVHSAFENLQTLRHRKVREKMVRAKGIKSSKFSSAACHSQLQKM